MAILYIVVQYLTLHVRFSDVSGNNFWTNMSLSNLNTTKLVSAMITEQMRICPYIALCNSPNTSDFTPRTRTSTPCCQKCSCDYTCVEDGTCCPDFYQMHFKTNAHTTETTTQLAYLDVNQTNTDRRACIKSQYGPILNSDGFTMVASCPANFQDNEVKRKCEMKFDYLSPFDIYDHIPATDTISGVTFKNRFCVLCNFGTNISATFWNVWLKCEHKKISLHYYSVKNPLEFAEHVISDQTNKCNIAFDLQNSIIGLDTTLLSCKTDTFIDSCDEHYSNHVLRTLCSKYVWPIKNRSYLGTRIYKNYACLLCNGMQFWKYCWTSDDQFAILLPSLGDTKQTESSNANNIENTIPVPRDQVIERYFPNDAGEVYCQKGFVYDSKRDSCRLVMCPLYFFVKNGVCVPLFTVIKGIVYQVLLHIDEPFILRGEDEEIVVNAIASSLSNLLRDNVGEGQYAFYIWKNNKIPSRPLVNRQYLIILAISGNFDEGRYVSMLNFINNFVLLEKQLSISITNGNYSKPITIYIHLDTSTELTAEWRPYKQYSNSFQLLRSYNGTKTLDIKHNGAIFFISPTVLCYRTTLFENEAKSNVLKPLYISISSRELVWPNFERIYHNKRNLIMVCLDHAFNNIPETVSYIFLNKNLTNYKFVTRHKFNNPTKIRGINDDKTGTEEDILWKKSTIATLATMGVVAIVILIRKMIKRLITEERNTASTEESVINMTTGYKVSRDEGSNMDNGREKYAGNKGKPGEQIQAVMNDNEITNESVERFPAPEDEKKSEISLQ